MSTKEKYSKKLTEISLIPESKVMDIIDMVPNCDKSIAEKLDILDNYICILIQEVITLSTATCNYQDIDQLLPNRVWYLCQLRQKREDIIIENNLAVIISTEVTHDKSTTNLNSAAV